MSTEQSFTNNPDQNEEWTNVHGMPVNEGMQNNTASNMTLTVIQRPPRGGPDVIQRAAVPSTPSDADWIPFSYCPQP